MSQFSKKVLTAAVLACLTGTAIAADKGPTLSDVFKNSGVDVTGYIDVTYTNLSTDAPLYQAYTVESNAFNLNGVDVAVSKLPASGFGGMVEMMAGEDVAFNRQKGWNSTEFDLLQAFAQYAGGGFTAQGGKFTTLAGAEVAQASNNANVSRSLLYTLAIPVTHTGLRGTYALGDAFKFGVGVNNGWDVLKETAAANCVGTNCADGKTLELFFSGAFAKWFSLTAAAYTGEEAGATNVGKRNLVDVVATFPITDALTVVANFDMGDQENGTATGEKAKWTGVAGYVNYKFTDQWRLSVRAEQFDDKDCYRTACATASQKLTEGTVTVGYAPVANFELRAELRQDKSDQDVFVEDGVATDKQTYLGLEAVYKF